MGKNFSVTKFDIEAGDQPGFDVSGTRFYLAKSSAREVMINFGNSGWLTVPRGATFKMPQEVKRVSIKSVDYTPIRGELFHGEAEIDFSAADEIARLSDTVVSEGVSSRVLVSAASNKRGMRVDAASVSVVPGTVGGMGIMYTTGATYGIIITSGDKTLGAPVEVPPGEGLHLTVVAAAYVYAHAAFNLY